MLLPNERIDDLLVDDLKIVQSKEVFSYSLGAVLLAHFCFVPKRGKVVDLCTGNGVIPLLLSTRTAGMITGVEIQPRLLDMAVRSVQMNKLTGQIQLLCADLRTVHCQLGFGEFDAVTVNPPYLSAKQTVWKNTNEHIARARHEIDCTLDDVTAACSRLVKSGGKVALVHRPGRLVEIIQSMKRVHLEPKRIRFVHPRAKEEANMVLIEAVKDGGSHVRLLPPMIVFEEGQQYTAEMRGILYGRAARN